MNYIKFNVANYILYLVIETKHDFFYTNLNILTSIIIIIMQKYVKQKQKQCYSQTIVNIYVLNITI